jgi:hypothetical protein
MTISKIYLAIDQNGANYSARSDLDFEVFFISEYVSKDLCKNKFKYKEANKLITYIESTNQGVEYDKLFKTLDYKSTLSYLNISQLEGQERTEKILGLIEAAGSAYDNFIPGIRQAMRDSIDRFRNSGYKNVWLFKRKRIDLVRQVELICELDREMFTLTLVAKNKNTEIYRRDILKTKPSSVIYHHKFKDILVDENNIVIIDRFGKPIYQVSISDVN